MKKSLVALAALAVAGIASAQSSVTLFGVVDASISSVSNKSNLYVANPLAYINNPLAYYGVPNSVTTSKTGLNNSAYNSSRLGFRGTEDLGGGLAASFWLESQLNNNDNTTSLNMGRRSTVSLSGGFGEIRLGRDYKSTFWNLTVFDPFGTNGSGTTVLLKAINGLESGTGGAVRANNMVAYFLPPNLGGFYGQLQYGFNGQLKADSNLQGAVNNNSRGGRNVSGRFGYANGPLDVAVAYSQTTNASDYTGGTDALAKDANVGASYDFGVVKLYGIYANVKNSTQYGGSATAPLFYSAASATTTTKGYQLGVTVPVGAGLIRASYGHVKQDTDQAQNLLLPNFFAPAYSAPKADQFAIGYVYNLSKRTALYATATYVKDKNGAAYTAGSNSVDAPFAAPVNGFAYRPSSSLGYDLGIRHAF